MTQTLVFTSAAFNYIPKVRMLCRSLRQHHPEWKLHLVLADRVRPDIDLSAEPFDEVTAVANLGIPSWEGWAYCHGIVELATAIKPFMLARLLQTPGAKRVIYLDPDIVAFSRLDDIVAALEEATIVLTPHQTRPEESLAAVMDNEICSLQHGIYNLGFIGVAVTDVGREFASWWSRRAYHFCRADIPNGLFTDQRWIDLVPAFFEGVAIMRSGRHNVATWNLTTREFSQGQDGQYLVDGEPLGFYHFTGFDSGAHRVMAKKNAGGNRAVHKLISWYEAQTKALAGDPLADVPWAYGVHSDGSPISREQRLVYRERTDLQRAFANPFDAAGFNCWWQTQGRVEYPDLFDVERRAPALRKLSEALTPGYRGTEPQVEWSRVGDALRHALLEPGSAVRVARRGWEVLRTEGVGGVRRRLRR